MYIVSLIKSLKPYRREHWMMLAILLYSLVGVLKYYLPSAICNYVQVASALTFIVVIGKNISGFNLKGLTSVFYAVLILWSLCLTFHMFFFADVRSTFAEYHGLTTWLLAYFGSAMFLPNLIPFVILAFPRNYQFDYRYLWRVMWLMCILYLCYYPFAFWSMTHYSWSFDQVVGTEWGDKGTYGDFITNSTIGISSLLPAVIMIYFKKYLPVKRWRYFLITYVGGILMAAFMARRGGLAISLLYLVMCWIMYSLHNKGTSKVKMILMAAVVVGLCFVLFTNMSDSFFSTLMERGAEDSREGVEDGFYSDMNKKTDWIFGRGWFGEYYEPLIGEYRHSIETGYLVLILRGGFLYLIPYALILAISFFNGYFRSKNLFCKSFAIMCLMQLISLYPFGWPAFNFFHFIIWIGVWYNNNSKFRKSSDNSILSYFHEERFFKQNL